jgi:hypothetical protein
MTIVHEMELFKEPWLKERCLGITGEKAKNQIYAIHKLIWFAATHPSERASVLNISLADRLSVRKYDELKTIGNVLGIISKNIKKSVFMSQLEHRLASSKHLFGSGPHGNPLDIERQSSPINVKWIEPFHRAVYRHKSMKVIHLLVSHDFIVILVGEHYEAKLLAPS